MYGIQKLLLPLAIGLALATAGAGAEESANGGDFRLDPLVVTTTLASETANESLSSVTVIDSEALEKRQANELSQALQGQAGLNVVTNGGFGKNTSVFTRGTGSESTLFLLDGIRIRSATSGGAPWQFIPPQLLHSVEVVRGPRSSLYGADAVGGVVQGFTRPRDGSDSQWAEIGGGSFDTFRGGAGVAGTSGNTGYSIQGHFFDTNGTELTDGGEDKRFDNASGNISVDHEFDNGTRVQVLGFRAEGDTESGLGQSRNTDFHIQTLGARLEMPVTRHWETQVELSESRDEQNSTSSFGTSVFDTRTRTVRWENTIGTEGQQLIVGAEHRNDEVSSTTDFAEDSRYNRAVFGQLLLERGMTDLQASVRWDDNEAFGNSVTGSAAMGMEIDRRHRIRLSYGTAFRAPTFNDLFFPFTPFTGFPDFEGNENLSPERSDTAEFGVRGQYRHAFWDVAFFQTKVDDLIVNQTENGVTQPRNVERARIQGVELTSGVQWRALELRSAATFQDPENRNTGERLARRTTRSLRLDADYTIGPVSAGATGIFEGDRRDTDGSSLGGFGVLNLRANWNFAPSWTLGVRAENLTDKEYQTAGGFDNPGRSGFITLRYGSR